MEKNIVNTVLILSAVIGLNACGTEEQNTPTITQEISNVIDAAYLNDDAYKPNENPVSSNGQERIEVPLLESKESVENEIIPVTPTDQSTQQIQENPNSAIDDDNTLIDNTVELSTEVIGDDQPNVETSPEVTNNSNNLDQQTLDKATTSIEPPKNKDNLPLELQLKPNFAEPVTEVRSAYEEILEELLKNYETIDYTNSVISNAEKQKVTDFCKKVSNRLGSVSMKGCLAANHRLSPFESHKGDPIVVTEFPPKSTRAPLGRVLVIGGTHGDELTSISTAYKWIQNLNKFHSGLFHWHIAPTINPDGLLIRPATRTNANGIDINRNLPTPDWDKQSLRRWEKSNKDVRKDPGRVAGSESESRWIMHEIATFKPDAIISIHAPYGVLDFDSPELKNAPRKFGRLKLNLLGTYPGSLGNYAGIERQIPVLTLELPNAVAMPSKNELDAIWGDMISWLKRQLS